MNKTYVYLWVIGTALFLFSILSDQSKQTVDINFRGTYYIISYGFIAKIFTLLFYIIGTILWAISKVREKRDA